VGGINNKQQPTICGGEYSSTYYSDCYSFDKTSWIKSDQMPNTISFAAVAQSPFPNKSHQFILTGGRSSSSGYLSTMYSQKIKGWEQQAPNLPVNIGFHCMVLLNFTTLLMIGGHNGITHSKTFIINTSGSKTWVSGPSLKFSRHQHSCSRIKSNPKASESFSVVVAGGSGSQTYMSSTEVLDEGSNEWRQGPDLPFGIYGAAMVEDPEGGVILIGGYSSSNKNLDTLFRLSDVGDGASWKEMPQKLQLGRYYPTAMMIPDHIVNCTIE
jgi:N-acetylneuraminic acid mutarotase